MHIARPSPALILLVSCSAPAASPDATLGVRDVSFVQAGDGDDDGDGAACPAPCGTQDSQGTADAVDENHQDPLDATAMLISDAATDAVNRDSGVGGPGQPCGRDGGTCNEGLGCLTSGQPAPYCWSCGFPSGPPCEGTTCFAPVACTQSSCWPGGPSCAYCTVLGSSCGEIGQPCCDAQGSPLPLGMTGWCRSLGSGSVGCGATGCRSCR